MKLCSLSIQSRTFFSTKTQENSENPVPTSIDSNILSQILLIQKKSPESWEMLQYFSELDQFIPIQVVYLLSDQSQSLQECLDMLKSENIVNFAKKSEKLGINVTQSLQMGVKSYRISYPQQAIPNQKLNDKIIQALDQLLPNIIADQGGNEYQKRIELAEVLFPSANKFISSLEQSHPQSLRSLSASRILMKLGTCSHIVFQNSKWALSYLEFSIKTLDEIGQSTNIQKAHCLGYLAHIYENLGNMEKTLEYMNKSHDLYTQITQISNEPNADYATSCSNLGILLDQLGQTQQGLTLVKESLDLMRKIHITSPKHLDIAASLCNLGSIYYSRELDDEALQCFEEAQEIFDFLKLGANPQQAILLSNLGEIQMYLGDTEESKALHKKSLEMSLKLFGTNHVNISMSYMNLARVEKDPVQAKNLILKAIQLNQEIFPENSNLHCAQCLYELSKIHLHLKEYSKAIEAAEHSSHIYKNLFTGQGNHPLITMLYNLLIQLYSHEGDHLQTSEYHQLLIQNMRENHEGLQQEFLEQLIITSLFYEKHGWFDKANELKQQALDIANKYKIDNMLTQHLKNKIQR